MYKLTVFTDITRKIMYLQYNFMKNKENLRKWAKTQRLSKNFDKKNETILKNIKNFSIFKNSNNIMLFYPTKGELNLLALLSEAKNYSFPITNADNIIPYKYNGNFCTGLFNIQEPENSIEQHPDELELVIIPALCVDKHGNRIGYGKGYYDRFLKTLNRNKTKCIVAIWNEFVVDEIETDAYDEKIDYIITETQIIKIID